jgi:hypothetical protein
MIGLQPFEKARGVTHCYQLAGKRWSIEAAFAGTRMGAYLAEQWNLNNSSSHLDN